MDRNIRIRIQKAVDTLCDGNKSEFCRRIDRPAQAIKDIIGGRQSAPGYELIYDILSSDLGISPSWLLTGDGPMLKEEKTKTKSFANVNSLPLIPFEAVAGPGTTIYEDERVEDFYTVSEFKDSDFLIRVKGDSMTPKFTGGDLLACKKIALNNMFFFQWGRCYVLYTESQGVMVKRIQPSEKEGWIKCVSDNVKYAPFDVPMQDIVSVALVNGSISLE